MWNAQDYTKTVGGVSFGLFSRALKRGQEWKISRLEIREDGSERIRTVARSRISEEICDMFYGLRDGQDRRRIRRQEDIRKQLADLEAALRAEEAL